ncbi:MAG: diaminopimelate decarboxylase [Bacteroidota bacterium]|nr:diaminopimelate decarboxylase [Bacteroidota bacterium]
MKTKLPVDHIESIFRSALAEGLIREEDTAVIFYDLDFLAERVQHLASLFPETTLHGIAMKANPLIEVLKYLQNLGMGVETASLGEVTVALKSGYPASRIVFDSPVKTVKELEFALKEGIHLNLDSLDELDRVTFLRQKISSKSTIGLRINPQVGKGTIEESSVAGEYSKFGIPLNSKRKQLLEAFLNHNWLQGVHLHVGSQGCPLELLVKGVEVLYNFAEEVNHTAGRSQIRIFDIGGGLPVSYTSSDHPPLMEEYRNALKTKFPLLFTDQYSLITEFGRWTHANTGFTVSRVEYVKHDPGINTAMIHTGADLFVRECLNPKAWHHQYTLLDRFGIRKGGKDMVPYNLGGPLCFSGDILARNVTLPEVKEGDYLMIQDTGGYTYSMWSRYNSRQTPRILGYRKGKFLILRERESLEDLCNFWK